MIYLYLFCKNGIAASYGVGTYVKQLMLALKEESIQLNIIIVQSKKKTFQIEYNDNVRYIHIPPILDQSLSNEEKVFCRKVIAYLIYPHIEDNAKNLFLFNYLTKKDFIELLRNYWSNSRMVYVVHFIDYDGKISVDDLSFMNSMNHLICLSKDTKRKLIEDYKIPQDKISLIYNGIEDRYQSITEEKKLKLRRKYFIRPEEKILLFVGRVDLFKGVDLLIEVMRRLLLWNENIHLFVVGDGLLDMYMKKCTPLWGRISFTGKLSEEVLKDLYQISDLGIIPSLQEQCSFVGIEMLMFGLPAIVSKVSGLDEMFEEQKTFVYKALPVLGENDQDYSEWVNAIKYALINSTQLSEIQKHTRACYKNKFTLEKMKNSYLRLFTNMFNIK